MKQRIILALAGLGVTIAWGAGSEKIRLNQVGYAVDQAKIAVSLDVAATSATLVDSATGTTVFQGALGPAMDWAEAGESGRLFDFSSVVKPGTYLLKIGNETSHPVRISANPYQNLSRASIKAFWYNRASYALPATYAGAWTRSPGHPDTAVLVHNSAANAARPANSKIRSPGGWYDAGDYGKYIVNSGISTWTLLHLYDLNRPYFDSLKLNIPAHGGLQSDLVDEIFWNLRWMLTMQDPNDGGVYHKLTTAQFSGFVMPAADKAARYVVAKSTQAALDFAAVTAYAARLFRNDTAALPGFADSCLKASLSAWAWARANPGVYYNQDALTSPAVGTGTYGDGNSSDELTWAASELYLTTAIDSFASKLTLATKIKSAANLGWGHPYWGSVATLGFLSLQANKSSLAGSLAGLGPKLDSGLTAAAASIRDYRATNGYHVPQGSFNWGGNSEFANNGILMWKAWMATGDTSYRNASLESLDYLLGRNATGYCFVTGFGSKPPMNPHHRPSYADGVVDPEPGFLVGGANATAPGADECPSPYTNDAKVYVDSMPCYASNEVAINWNAPLAFLAGVWSARLDGFVSTDIHAPSPRAKSRIVLGHRSGSVEASLEGRILTRLEVLSPDGRLLGRVSGPAAKLSLQAPKSGIVVVKAWAADGSTASGSMLVQ